VSAHPEAMNHNAHREKVGPVLAEIRRMIEESDLSERKISIRAGLSPGYVTQLLTGKRELKIWHLLAILDALGCNAGDFFTKVNVEPRLQNLEGKIKKLEEMPMEGAQNDGNAKRTRKTKITRKKRSGSGTGKKRGSSR
jgi:transcriptional regulator with XRE-family HTH domain